MMPRPVTAGLLIVGELSSPLSAERSSAPGSASISLARPKSSTFTVPSGRTLMLAGFRSR